MPTRLKRTKENHLCITRQRRGKGFSYHGPDGSLIADPVERERFATLGIPPAWTDVRICRHPNGHLQVRGRDEAGRSQYIYHPDWELQRDSRKLARLRALTTLLADVREQVGKDLSAPKGSLRLAQAVAVALIDRTAMRIGRERYLEENGTRGAATLLKKDVRIKGDTVNLRFTGKGGKKLRYAFRDPALARAMTRLKDLPGPRLLQHIPEAIGTPQPMRSEAVNTYLRTVCGGEISAKDLRTLRASALAGEVLAGAGRATSKTARERTITAAARQVAEVLQNTPAISKKSYIASPILKAFRQGRLAKLWPTRTSARARLEPAEQHLKRFLEAAPKP